MYAASVVRVHVLHNRRACTCVRGPEDRAASASDADLPRDLFGRLALVVPRGGHVGHAAEIRIRAGAHGAVGGAQTTHRRIAARSHQS